MIDYVAQVFECMTKSIDVHGAEAFDSTTRLVSLSMETSTHHHDSLIKCGDV